MPHASLKLRPGLDTNETPALNEAGLTTCNLIRLFYDRNGVGLCQKLGGWTRYFPNTLTAIARALWAWEDTAAQKHLAVGTENIGTTFQAQLGAVTDGALRDITPRSKTDNITPAAASTITSSIVTITDATITDITRYDAVYIPAHIAIGGLILFGLYACNPDGHSAATTYTVQALDALGAALAATSTSSTPTVALFSTTISSTAVTVTLAGHGYVVGSIYPVLIQTTVGGIAFYGEYVVQTVVDANNFTITGLTSATATTTGSINGGKARYVYSFSVGAVPAGTGFGIGGFGRGGFGVGAAITPSLGSPIRADDWTLDNWGQVLIACPSNSPVAVATTSASGTGVTGTLAFTGTYTAPVGNSVTVSGMVPSSWNGTYVLTASTSSSVSFATAVVAAQTTAGTITLNEAPFEPIYQWDAQGGAPIASIIPQAPPVNEGVFVAMPERQIVAYGSTFTGIQDPLLVRWCDIDNYSSWIGTVTNQAGSFRLPRGSRIVGGFQGPQQALLWTDIGVWSMQYVNQPYIYSFNEIGSGCGLIAKKAAGALNGSVYWMGPSQFYVLGDNGVEPLPCPVWDVVFQDIDDDSLDKVRVAVNSRFGEIAWYYPSSSSGGEVSNYIKFNVFVAQTMGAAAAWDFGTLARSAWIDQSVLGPPIGADPTNLYLYQHETSNDADGVALEASLRTGWFALNDGDLKTFVDQIWPDLKWGDYGGMQSATVNLTIYAVDYPGETPRTYGPYAMTQSTTFLTPRIRARLVAFELSSSDTGSFWRLGALRYRYAPDGKF